MAKTTGPITMEIKITDTAFGAQMRDSLLAVLGPINSFKDSEGDAFHADGLDFWHGEAVITLSATPPGSDEPSEIIFFKADATKIIALIAEAAK